MTSKQYRKTIESLGLTQQQAARWLGISPRTSQSYALGETRIPEPVAKLLRLTIKLEQLTECAPLAERLSLKRYIGF